MTDQHRATPEQWALIAKTTGGTVSDTILEPRSRIEALEAAQLEQAESHRFCTDAIVRRVEALEAFDHRPLLAAVRAQSKAVAHFGNRLEALEADQRYQFRSATEKVPTTRLYSYSVGPAKPLDELGQGHTLVSPEPSPAAQAVLDAVGASEPGIHETISAAFISLVEQKAESICIEQHGKVSVLFVDDVLALAAEVLQEGRS